MLRYFLYPFLFLKSYLYNDIIRPLIYGKKSDYDAERFWHDRFRRHRFSLRGVGNIALSEEENVGMYNNSAKHIINLLRNLDIDISKTQVLDVGCGNGFLCETTLGSGIERLLWIGYN